MSSSLFLGPDVVSGSHCNRIYTHRERRVEGRESISPAIKDAPSPTGGPRLGLRRKIKTNDDDDGQSFWRETRL